MSKALILSWNPVPTVAGKSSISATGMRCYKLAAGLVGSGLTKVDIAVKNYENGAGAAMGEEVNIISWENDKG